MNLSSEFNVSNILIKCHYLWQSFYHYIFYTHTHTHVYIYRMWNYQLHSVSYTFSYLKHLSWQFLLVISVSDSGYFYLVWDVLFQKKKSCHPLVKINCNSGKNNILLGFFFILSYIGDLTLLKMGCFYSVKPLFIIKL